MITAGTPVLRAARRDPEAVRHARFEREPGGRVDAALALLWADRLDGDPIPPSGGGHSFSDMCRELVADLRAAGPLELVVLAHVTPDLDARDSVAGALAAPEVLVFAVSDQGRLAPFTALRLAAAFPDRPHAAVIALDQAVVPYTDTDLSALDVRTDHAVVLLPALGLGPVRQWADVTGDRVADLLAKALPAERPDLVILGPYLSPPSGIRWRRAPGDQLVTAVFSALSAEITTLSSANSAGADRAKRITVVEYEPAFRGLALVTWSMPGPARPAMVPAAQPDLPNQR